MSHQRDAEFGSRREIFGSPSNRIGTPLIRLQHQGPGPDLFPWLSYWIDGAFFQAFDGSNIVAPRFPDRVEPVGFNSGTSINWTQGIRVGVAPNGTRFFFKAASKKHHPNGLGARLPGARCMSASVCAASPNVVTRWRYYAIDQYGEPFSEDREFRGRTHELPMGFTGGAWPEDEPPPHGVAGPPAAAPMWPPGNLFIDSIVHPSSPAQITFEAPHGLSTGDGVIIAGCPGTTSVNNTILQIAGVPPREWVVTVVNPTTITIPVATNAPYTGAGATRGKGYGLNQVGFVSWFNSAWANLSPRPVDEAVEGPRFYNPNNVQIRMPRNVQDGRWGELPLDDAFQFQRPSARPLWVEFLGGDNIGVNDVVVFGWKSLNFGLRTRLGSLDNLLGGQVVYKPITKINVLGSDPIQGFLIWQLNPLETQLLAEFCNYRSLYNVLSFQTPGLTPIDGEEGSTVNPHVYAGNGDLTVNHQGEMILTFASWRLEVEVGYDRR